MLNMVRTEIFSQTNYWKYKMKHTENQNDILIFAQYNSQNYYAKSDLLY